ncbi:GntR family transcriptional regulator [Paenarthrobacter sp. PAE-2]|uniref:GntR family transcriptional regulator n=1 Tax=Paenarthrobacter sp. PAE-2 TaxID=2982532 RepID=UPI002232039B|nr:GntR family transcriptional regulator [Paenarthrobacter sp. PAE-2]MCW3767113.1 GntR family transcriptional regulator [Paenarthrobacter sp. PAE-2]
MIQASPTAPSQPEVAYQWMKSYIAAIPRDEETFLNEAVLAKSTGTSRTPVREALLRLEAEGFVKRIPHKGAYVPPISDPDVRAILQARSVVEKWAVLMLDSMQDHQIEAFQRIIDQQREARDDPARFIELDTEFHTLMVRAGANPILADFYASLRQRQLRIGVRAVTQGTDRAGDVLREHQLIVDALRSRSIEAAHAAIDAHLDSTRQAVIGY